ncbi:MAG: hypothetical protein ACLVKK_12500 [Ruthenibacterium sp.]
MAVEKPVNRCAVLPEHFLAKRADIGSPRQVIGERIPLHPVFFRPVLDRTYSAEKPARTAPQPPASTHIEPCGMQGIRSRLIIIPKAPAFCKGFFENDAFFRFSLFCACMKIFPD